MHKFILMFYFWGRKFRSRKLNDFSKIAKIVISRERKSEALFSAKNKEQKILKITGSKLCSLSSQQGNVDKKFSSSSVSVRAWT